MQKYCAYVVRVPTSLASSEFLDAGVRTSILPAKFNFLSSEVSGLPIGEALEFLSSRCLSTLGPAVRFKKAVNSNIAYCQDLLDFFNFLDASTLSLADVDEAAAIRYLRTLYGVSSSSTGKQFADATITRRMSTVRDFLRFAQARGWIKKRFGVAGILPEPQGAPESRDEISTGKNDVVLIEPDDINVTFIDPIDLGGLLDEIGRWFSTENDIPLEGPRDRLMAECSLQSGLRRTEVSSITVAQVAGLKLGSADPLSTRALTIVGKGSKARRVPVPVWLLRALQRYIQQDRAQTIALRQSSNSRFIDRGKLFVHLAEARGSAGDPVSSHQFGRRFAAARSRLLVGLPQDAEAAHRSATIKQYVPHSLRHNFALHAYIARRALGDPNPGKYVQSVLGHAYQETTDRLYLRASHIYELEASEFMQRIMMQRFAHHG